MKKTLLFLFCGIAALCVSCKEGDDAATRFSFSLPEVVSVGSTTADVSSRAGFTLNDYPGLERGFAYGPADEAAEGYRTVKVTEFERNAISARLTGLDPETSYRVHAYVKLGASRILSDGAEFTTLPGDGGGDETAMVMEMEMEMVMETAAVFPGRPGTPDGPNCSPSRSRTATITMPTTSAPT